MDSKSRVSLPMGEKKRSPNHWSNLKALPFCAIARKRLDENLRKTNSGGTKYRCMYSSAIQSSLIRIQLHVWPETSEYTCVTPEKAQTNTSH